MTKDEAIRVLVDTVFPDEQLEGDNRRKSANLVDESPDLAPSRS